MPASPVPPSGGRPAWASTQYSYVALALNGLGLVVLFANLIGGNTWWEIAVPIALGCFVLGGLSALQARRLRSKERRPGG